MATTSPMTSGSDSEPASFTFDMTSIPAMVPPPGQTSNFVDPPTLHPIVLTLAISTMTLITLVVTLRIFTKAYVMREFRPEEYFCVLATIGILVWDGIYIHVSYSGFSRHLWDVRLSDISHFAWMSYLAEISYALTMFAAKASILFQLRTLFCPDSPSHRRLFTAVTRREYATSVLKSDASNPIFWALYGLMFLNGAYYLAAFFSFVFQCTPREKAWDLIGEAAREGSCIDVAAATVVGGVMNLVLDLGILVVPIWAIWRLKLSVKRRLGISAVFAVGAVTCVIAAVGVAVRVPLLWDGDLTWIIAKVGIWTMVEYFGTILVGCMPSFPRFFLFVRGREPNTTTHAASTAASGGGGAARMSKTSFGSGNGRSAEQNPISSPIQVPRSSLQKTPSVVLHYSNSPVVSDPKRSAKPRNSPITAPAFTYCDKADWRTSSSWTSPTTTTRTTLTTPTIAGSPIGVALSTSELSFTRPRTSLSTDASSFDQAKTDYNYIELEEGRYSRDDGGHVGHPRCTSFHSYRASVCHDDDDDDDEEARQVIIDGTGTRESGFSGNSGGGYYDDADMDEYWAGPGPVVRHRGSL
ncbi:hypothetical protein V8F06_014228 [Rhypophila decipiens]